MLVVALGSFCSVTRSFLSPDQFTIAMGLLILLSTLVASCVVDRTGRRPLLLLSSLGCAVFELLAALYYYLDSKTTVDMAPYSWAAFATISSYCVIFSLGVGPLVPVLQAELFPSNTRGMASGQCIYTLLYLLNHLQQAGKIGQCTTLINRLQSYTSAEQFQMKPG